MTTKRKTKPKRARSPLTVYQERRPINAKVANSPVVLGPWRWRLKGSNNRIVSASSESFTRRSDALRNFRAAAKLAAKALSEMEGK